MQQLLGTTLLDGHGNAVDTSTALGQGTTVVGLYFSAQWCPPCRAFTPLLAKLYQQHSKSHAFEVVFASRDRNEKAFQDYFREMPWLALPFGARGAYDQLAKQFNAFSGPSCSFPRVRLEVSSTCRCSGSASAWRPSCPSLPAQFPKQINEEG